MALKVTKINSVDKLFIDAVNIVYRFPQATLTVNTATTAITVLLSYAGAVSSTTKFGDLIDNYATADAEAYADYLASNSFFFEVAGVGVGDATSANQVIGNAYLSSIDTKVSTSALQTTGNSTLSSILSGLSALATSALQTVANGFLSTISAFTAFASTSALQTALNALVTTANGYLATIAGGTAGDATASNQAIQIQFDKGLDKGDGVQTSVGVSNAAVAVLALSTTRIGVILFNDGNNTFFVRFGGTASTTDFSVQIPSKGLYEVPYFACNSAISAIKSNAGTDQLKVTTFTRLI